MVNRPLMGICGGKPKQVDDVIPGWPEEDCNDDVVKGLGMKPAAKCRLRAYIKFAETSLMNRGKPMSPMYMTHHGLLLGIAKKLTWDVYLKFDADWPAQVSALAVDRLLDSYRKSLAQWLQKLKGYHDFPTTEVSVRLFGVVMAKGVTADESFYAKYGKYPRVEHWQTDACPWKITCNMGTDCGDLSKPKLDLHSIQVVGNKPAQTARFYPTEWKGFTHPEKCVGFQTKYWLGGAWNAVAQRSYLRIGGQVSDAFAGQLSEHGARNLTHEMGHCFFLDDLYDKTLYPETLPNCPHPNCAMRPNDSIMWDATTIQPMDWAWLRRTWDVQKSVFG